MSTDNEIKFKQLLADSPILLERFTGADSNLKKALLKEVDESSFALSDWLESLVLLDKYLDQKGLSLSPRDSIGYISCVAKSVSNSATLIHLPSLVNDFLEQYGCERAVKK